MFVFNNDVSICWTEKTPNYYFLKYTKQKENGEIKPSFFMTSVYVSDKIRDLINEEKITYHFDYFDENNILYLEPSILKYYL
jgi:hypothetical protein